MRFALRYLLLFALLMRALVPVGYMPAAAADGHGLSLVICNGSGELQAIALDDQGNPVPPKSEKSSHEPCAFAGHVALSAPSFDAAILMHIVEADRVPVVALGVVRPPVRAGPPLGSRAPPHRS